MVSDRWRGPGGPDAGALSTVITIICRKSTANKNMGSFPGIRF